MIMNFPMTKTVLIFIFSIICLICENQHTVQAQTVTIVGTAHLNQLEKAPNHMQLERAVNAMSMFDPTQVCIEVMSGERIEVLDADPSRHGTLLRYFASDIVRAGSEQQRRLEIRPSDARKEAREMVEKWDQLSGEDRGRLIQLQMAGFEFYSAVLSWSYLTKEEKEDISAKMGKQTRDILQRRLKSNFEVLTLAIPLAKKAGLHELCYADSAEDEVTGTVSAHGIGLDKILEKEEVKNKFVELNAYSNSLWQPESGPDALVRMLIEYNSEEYAATDRKLQWETLHDLDNEKGASIRRLMYWHARSSEINAELYRALGQGPDERVLFIVGAAHRPFNEAALRSQPWIKVKPATDLFNEFLEQ
jgi:hypothetical protein